MKTILLLLLNLIFCVSCYAAPLIPGGVITSPFGEANHFGHTHAGIDIGLGSGTPILAPAAGQVTHGSGGGFIYWTQIDCEDGLTYFVGDCREDTLNCPTGYVAAGTIIGITGGDAYNGPLGISTGPHAHIEVFNGTGYALGMQVDPYPYLKMIGVDLSGENIPSGDGQGSGPIGGIYGSDDVELPWGVESMHEFGDNLNSDMERYSQAAIDAFGNITAYAVSILAAIAIIDLTLPMLLSGMAFSWITLITKILKYGFFCFLIYNWNVLINDFFLSIVSSISGSFINDPSIITQNLTQPQMIIQKVVYLMTPALAKIASYKSIAFMLNLAFIVPIFLTTWITIILYFFLALKVTITYIEFYCSAVFNVITIPFANWRFTKFIPEGTLGHLFTITIELMVTAIMICLMVMLIQDANPADLYSIVDDNGHLAYLDSITVIKHCKICCGLWALAFLTGFIPAKIAKLVGGHFELR